MKRNRDQHLRVLFFGLRAEIYADLRGLYMMQANAGTGSENGREGA